MPDALDLLENLEALNVHDCAIDALKDNAEVIADMNAGQLAQGRRTDGSEILPPYKEWTIAVKSEKSGLAGVTDHVTLYDTGSHYRNLYAEIKGEEIEYGSHDAKSAKLEKKYGTRKGGLYGLTEDNSEDLVEQHLRGDFIEKIAEQTGL